MDKRLIIVGAGASGKDTFKNYLREQGYPADVSYTTRPPRKGEAEGRDYHFITDEEFYKLESEGFFYESVTFNGWKYGTSNESWKEKKVCIKTPSGITQLSYKDIKESIIVWLDIHEEYRLRRLMGRGDADTVERRILSDRKDFFNFNNFDIRIINPNFDPDAVLELIKLYDKI